MDVRSLEIVNPALQEFLLLQTRRAQLYSCFQEGFNEFLRTKREGDYKALLAELSMAFNDCSKKVIVLEGMLRELGRADLAAILRGVQESERDKLRLTLTLQALKQAAAFWSFSWQQQQQQQQGEVHHDGNGYDDDEALALLDPHFATAATCRAGCAHGQAHAHAQSRQGHGGHSATEPLVEEREGSLLETCSRTTAAAAPVTAAADTLANVGLEPGNRSGGAANGVPGAASSSELHALGKAAAGSSGGCSGGGGDVAPEPTRKEFEAAVKEATQGLDGCIRKINEAIDEIRMELEDS
ncbi:hypothetical protein VaNZ11_012854 [Volvox africanus]|uniref:Uncharacterized protein n=1 Tax=Volvox africanus TaxID=51714 RepID=A0ABQ5SG70_9CHLO|nr:hypothetical protein VaNZ11_012854 [Volvox africanus]